MTKNSYITVTDQFCGAGGSSQGVRLVQREKNLGSGLEVKLAMNHWKLAIETHNTNFPETDHVCTDISACDPRRYHSTDILITSPECTVHSPAGGGSAKKRMFGNQISLSGKLASEEAEERSRATMWDVCRFAEYHRYNVIIAENVIEARKWILFDTWLQAMVNLGYDHEIKYINSMHAHPTPQSRDRMYCVFWKKGNKKPNLNFNPVAPCNKCLKNVDAYQWWKPHKTRIGNYGKYKFQYLFKCPDCHDVVEPYYHAAFNCIDWAKPGTRIGDRKKVLSPKTTIRCQYGIDKYWDEPSFINVKYSSGIDFRVKSLSTDPLTTQPGDSAVGLLSPVIISSRYISGIASRVKPSGGPLPVQVTEARESVMFPPLNTVTTQQEAGMLNPPLIVGSEFGSGKPCVMTKSSFQPFRAQTTAAGNAIMCPPVPFLIKNYTSEHHNTIPGLNALGVITGHDHHSLVNPPLIDEQYGQSKPRPSIEALGAQPTIQKHGIITNESFNSFISYYYGGSNVATHITEPTRTFSTKERAMLVQEPYQKPKLEDCFYRMLMPHEIQLGMAFDPDYIVLGDSKQKVKQLGNAVTPPVMKFLIGRCVESLM
jgi:DNA (cytosine-5)-methyltransferase 1